MFWHRFYNEKLAHASYLVGCEKHKQAIVIDPGRDIEPYLEMSRSEGLRIVGVAETHIHADYVSGVRELAARLSATIYLSQNGDYKYVYSYPHRWLKDGDRFWIGDVSFTVLHTPGHTPEHLCFLVTDHVRGEYPVGLFSGDCLFVGDVGRPDLLEKAVGIHGATKQGIKDLYQSLRRLGTLPDDLQIWPAHGAGSPCGKVLGSLPLSTMGYEKKLNWAFLCQDPKQFEEQLLQGQPPIPPSFSRIKRMNSQGPALLPYTLYPPRRTFKQLFVAQKQGATILDVRQASDFAREHILGSINIPLGRSFVTWASWIFQDDAPLYLVVEKEQLLEVCMDLRYIGLDLIAGYMEVSELEESHVPKAAYEHRTVDQMSDAILQRKVTLIDVRHEHEWKKGHIPGAVHLPLGDLEQRWKEIPIGKPIVVQCQSGVRSAIAVSLLRKKGLTHVINLSGGWNDWVKQGYPVEGES